MTAWIVFAVYVVVGLGFAVLARADEINHGPTDNIFTSAPAVAIFWPLYLAAVCIVLPIIGLSKLINRAAEWFAKQVPVRLP